MASGEHFDEVQSSLQNALQSLRTLNEKSKDIIKKSKENHLEEPTDIPEEDSDSI